MEKIILPDEPGVHPYLIFAYDNKLYLRCATRDTPDAIITQMFMEEAGLENDVNIMSQGLISVSHNAKTILFFESQEDIVKSMFKSYDYTLKFY